ncbi:MAG: hypothetical protein AVDCRST_MAG53-3491 [uncultured Solirubrobacteraceae bacterium]|uniref:Uncharacterized protein n=1 Tax=uncultured Solirubrobacteraceae bacterium TaxID=1162706 RepID=A0A6J4TDH1_9ACTN|nr:MAG: hypothetical protein AVDCRST_MAG53-3491 [uncultured Solirubrobacteraceae bacterium]
MGSQPQASQPPELTVDERREIGRVHTFEIPAAVDVTRSPPTSTASDIRIVPTKRSEERRQGTVDTYVRVRR